MNGSRPRASRRLIVGLACLAVVAACSGDDDVDDGTSSGPLAAVDRNVSQPDAAAEIEVVFDQYWEAVISAQSGQSDDPGELFEGLAIDTVIEQNADVAVRYANQGITRIGEPVISDVNVQVVRDSAVVSACIDESEWLAELATGETLPPPDEQLAPHPIVFEAVNSDGSWLIGDAIEPGEETAC